MKNRNYFLAGVFALSLLACGTEETKTPAPEPAPRSYAELEKASWLVGTWESHSPEAFISESWQKQNDSTLAGKSFVLVGKDTVSSERLSLVQEGAQLFYIPTVKEQNNGQPVRFKMTSATGNELVFENPSHDFPQRITYKKISNDSLLAEISGMVEGKEQKQGFPMGRKK